MIKFKNIFVGNFVVYTILGFLPLSFSFFFIPIYTKYLTVDGFGLLNYFTVISSLVMPIVGLGIDQAFGFLYWEFDTDKEKSNYLMNIMVVFIFLLVLFSIIIIGLNSFNLLPIKIESNYIGTLEFLLFTVLFAFSSNVYKVFLGYFRNKKEIKNYSILSVSYLLSLIIGSLIGLVFLKLNLKGAIAGRTLGFFLIILVAIMFFYISNKDNFKLSKKLMQKTIKVSLPLIVAYFIGNIAYSVDKIIIEKDLGLKLLGIYSMGFTISYVLDILMNALSNTIIPDIFEDLKKEVNIDEKKLIGWFDFSVLCASLFGIAGFLYLKFIIKKPEFFQSLIIIQILSISIIPKTITQFLNLFFYKENKTKLMVLVITIFLAFNYITIYLFSTFFSITGAVVAFYMSSWFSLLLTRKILKIKFKLNILKYFVISVILVCMSLMTSFINLFQINFIYSLMLLLLPFFFVITFYYIFDRKRILVYIKLINNLNKNAGIFSINR